MKHPKEWAQLAVGEYVVILAQIQAQDVWQDPAQILNEERVAGRWEKRYSVKVLPKPMKVIYLGWSYVKEGYKTWNGDSFSFTETGTLRVAVVQPVTHNERYRKPLLTNLEHICF